MVRFFDRFSLLIVSVPQWGRGAWKLWLSQHNKSISWWWLCLRLAYQYWPKLIKADGMHVQCICQMHSADTGGHGMCAMSLIVW